ncbi:unnamed protein product [Cochlearia groenlandica]
MYYVQVNKPVHIKHQIRNSVFQYESNVAASVLLLLWQRHLSAFSRTENVASAKSTHDLFPTLFEMRDVCFESSSTDKVDGKEENQNNQAPNRLE